MPVTHPFVSAIPDSADPTLVNPSNWNANHTVNIDLTSEVTGTLPLANGGTGGTDLYTINGASIVGTGNLTLATSGAITGSGLTVATGKLLGRTTAGTGAVEEISVGSGLSLSAGTLSATGGAALTIQNKTGAYTVVAGDAGTIINCTSGTFTVSLTAAATLGAGFNCWIWNMGTGAITIDPNSTETIDGVSTLILRQGEGTQIVCNGTNIETGAKKTMRGYVENVVSTLTRPVASANYTIAMGSTSAGAGAQAVTGSGAMALGGSYASGTDSFAAAVANNTNTYGAQGTNAVVLGSTNKATNTRGSALGGGSNSVTGLNSTACGGFGNIGTANNSFIHGTESSDGGIYGRWAYAAGKFAAEGDAQSSLFVSRRSTTDATPTVITQGGGTAGAANQVILPNNSAYAFDGLVVARRQAAGGTESAAWQVSGLIRREANAASTTLVASTVTVISNVPAWTLALTADTTNGGLAVTFTGAAATNIRCVATIRTSECIYA